MLAALIIKMYSPFVGKSHNKPTSNRNYKWHLPVTEALPACAVLPGIQSLSQIKSLDWQCMLCALCQLADYQ